jgi:hypothetical protein
MRSWSGHLPGGNGPIVVTGPGWPGGFAELLEGELRSGDSDLAARRVGSETLLAHLEHRRVQTPAPSRSDSHHRAALAKIDQELSTIERLATGYGR